MALRKEALAGALEFYGGDELAARVWVDKYALRDKVGDFKETSPSQMHDRHLRYFPGDAGIDEATRGGWFVPAGRILFAMGNPYVRATQFNCYVIPIKSDSLEGIFECAKEMARTYSYGGGCGIDLGCLRPSGAPVNNTAMTSSGSVSFMDFFSKVTGTVGQHGRRGALMITIPVDHPDVLAFINAKDDLDPAVLAGASAATRNFLYNRRSVGHANVSVRLTDEFMEAVERGGKFRLRWPSGGAACEREVDARDYWGKLCHQSWRQAEPGLIFWGKMVEESPSNQYEGGEVLTTNPCGEQSLPAYDSCDLGSVNLRHMVRDPWTDGADTDWNRLEATVRAGVRFLDGVRTVEADEDRFPLPQQREASERFRRVGLGVMGLGEMIASLGMVYGSEECLKFFGKLCESVRDSAYDESVELARRLGPFPAFDWDRHQKCPFVQRLPQPLRNRIAKHGLRNVTVVSFAPTGTIAILGQTSGGIEPMFAPLYRRYSNLGGRERSEFRVYDPAISRWRGATGADFPSSADDVTPEAVDMLPPNFAFSHQIPWRARVDMQALAQRFVDSSISSTINLPPDASEDEVSAIYTHAWKSGCKGVTVYREGCRENILETIRPAGPGKPEKAREPWTRPTVMDSRSVSFMCHNNRVLIDFCRDSGGKLKEVKIVMGRSGDEIHALCEALGRCVSKLLQSGADVAEIAESLRGIKSGQTQWLRFDSEQDAPYVVRSVPDAMSAYMHHAFVKPAREAASRSTTTSPPPPGGPHAADESHRAGSCPQCDGIDEYGRS
jgi:ribonucleoside-diphosphate reductase alpha chain